MIATPANARVPFSLYRDPEVYAREQTQIFRGKSWSGKRLRCHASN